MRGIDYGALMTAQSGYTLKEAASDHEYWGRHAQSQSHRPLRSVRKSPCCFAIGS
jgi:hypothetical protein